MNGPIVLYVVQWTSVMQQQAWLLIYEWEGGISRMPLWKGSCMGEGEQEKGRRKRRGGEGRGGEVKEGKFRRAMENRNYFFTAMPVFSWFFPSCHRYLLKKLDFLKSKLEFAQKHHVSYCCQQEVLCPRLLQVHTVPMQLLGIVL